MNVNNLSDYVTQTWTSADGLPGNSISDIVQSLDKSSKVLQNDNTTLLNEENYLTNVFGDALMISFKKGVLRVTNDEETARQVFDCCFVANMLSIFVFYQVKF